MNLKKKNQKSVIIENFFFTYVRRFSDEEGLLILRLFN
jgi:hypothetical protein